MKYSVFAIAMVAIVSALFSITPTGATGSGTTSTGSTLSGTTSTGSTASGTTSTGTTSTGVTAPKSCDKCGGGGPTVGYNRTTKQLEMVPQCFPWVWLTDYRNGNIFMLYTNQNSCRAKRFVDFGI